MRDHTSFLFIEFVLEFLFTPIYLLKKVTIRERKGVSQRERICSTESEAKLVGGAIHS